LTEGGPEGRIAESQPGSQEKVGGKAEVEKKLKIAKGKEKRKFVTYLAGKGFAGDKLGRSGIVEKGCLTEKQGIRFG